MDKTPTHNFGAMLWRLLAGDFSHIPDKHMRLRVKSFNAFSVIGLVIYLLFAVFQDVTRLTTALLVRDTIGFVMLVVPVLIVRRTTHYKLVFQVALCFGIVAQFASFLSNNTSLDANLFWLSISATAAYLLLGRWGGLGWSGAMVAATVTISLLQRSGAIHLSTQATTMLVQATLAMIGLSCALFAYEGINVLNQRLIAERDRSMNEANARLNRELAENKRLAAHLSEALADTQKHYSQLQDTQAAMINLLEDAKELQQQLEQEKVNVERVIEERTSELHVEQARLRASINSMDSGFLMTLRDGTVIAYNPALARLFNIIDESKNAPSSLSIHTVQEKLGKGYDLEGAIRHALKEGGAFSSGDVDLNGRVLSINGSPILPDGRFEAIGVVILVSDVTEIKMLEREKDEFVSIASHELRTPLTAIRGNSAMLLDMYGDQMPSEDIKQMLRDIKDGSVRLIAVVNQFLSMSRLEQGRTVFDIEELVLNDTMDRVINNLRSLADEKHIQLINKLPVDLPFVMADAARLEEICTNLVGNAIKYTESGSITVHAEADGSQVKVRVTDTGRGIDVASRGLLFRKFQQAATNVLTRDNSSSTGLGLYITKLLVEQMGGTIGLESSELGKGSTFVFTLPIHKDYNKGQKGTGPDHGAQDKEQ